MILDTSAVVAILRGEPDSEDYVHALAAADEVRMSAANVLEAAVVIDGARDPVVSRRFDDLLRVTQVRIEDVTARQVVIARLAYRDFGKGSGHPARLNFGDCFAYALARETGQPLLFKGDDFVHTDVVPVLPSRG